MIVETVGEGGQAHTFRVKDMHDGSTNWILKRLKNATRLDRFEREILALEAIDSPHIPKTVDYSVDETSAYHVSPDLGIGLDKYVSSCPLDVDHALDIFAQIVSAVRDAHATGAVIHRDIKPNNVVVSLDGEKAFLIDFGICQYTDGELTLLTTEEAFGNPAFAAPECTLGYEEEPGPPCDVYSLGKLFYWMISRGGYVHRETLSPTALNRIVATSELERSYLARLVRGVVAREPVERWTAARLLEEVYATKKLLDRVKLFQSRGQIIVTDEFGVDDSFYPYGSRSATTPDRGNPPSDGDIGVAFEVPVGQNVYLETLTLALQFRAGDELDVLIVPDLEGSPDHANPLETLTVQGSPSSPLKVECVRSREHPLLQKGQRYWIVLSVPRPESEVALYSASLDFNPRTALIAERFDGNQWNVAEASNGYAIRVTGRPAKS